MISPQLHLALAQAKTDDLCRAADRYRLTHRRGQPAQRVAAQRSVTLRFASPADQQPLVRLAEPRGRTRARAFPRSCGAARPCASSSPRRSPKWSSTSLNILSTALPAATLAPIVPSWPSTGRSFAEARDGAVPVGWVVAEIDRLHTDLRVRLAGGVVLDRHVRVCDLAGLRDGRIGQP
jgi:hypothetical protein